MLRKCIYGGGDACSRQGGDGSLHHGERYVHPYPTIAETGEPVGEFTRNAYTMEKSYKLASFDIDFDEDKAEGVLSLEISKGIVHVEELMKSLYEFDLESDDGVKKLLELLPILDPTLIVELVEKIWPGYVVQAADPDLLRAEVKGYLLDYLDGEYDEATTPTDPLGAIEAGLPEEPEEDEAGVAEPGTEPEGGEPAGAEESPAEEG